MESEHGGQPESVTDNDEEGDNFPITTIMAVVFILLICTVLLLLYFFYKYLIYVIIALFAFGATFGTYECLAVLMSFIPAGKAILIICLITI